MTSEQETTPPLEAEVMAEEAMAVEEEEGESEVVMATEAVQIQETSSTNMADTTTVTMTTVSAEEQVEETGQASLVSPVEAYMEIPSTEFVVGVVSEGDGERGRELQDVNEVSSGDNEEQTMIEGQSVCLSTCMHVHVHSCIHVHV